MTSSDSPVRPITTQIVDVYSQHCQLAVQLPPAKDKPRGLTCRKCKAYLGCVGNSRGIVFGHFAREDHRWSQLIGSAVISERKIPLKCSACGAVTVWRRPP